MKFDPVEYHNFLKYDGLGKPRGAAKVSMLKSLWPKSFKLNPGS